MYANRMPWACFRAENFPARKTLCVGFTTGSRILDHRDQASDRLVRLKRVAQRTVHIDLVVITTPVTNPCEHPGILQLTDDALHRSFRNADPQGNIPQSHGRVICETYEHVRVVAEKSP